MLLHVICSGTDNFSRNMSVGTRKPPVRGIQIKSLTRHNIFLLWYEKIEWVEICNTKKVIENLIFHFYLHFKFTKRYIRKCHIKIEK